MEEVLRRGELEILSSEPTPTGKSGASVLLLRARAGDGEPLVFRAKWKAAAPGGEELNNSPRRELAAYALQKVFLSPAEYVVPPTVGRCFPRAVAPPTAKPVGPVFPGVECEYGVLAYWLENVAHEGAYDFARLVSDDAYRHAAGDLNILTFLIDHRDSHRRNFVLARDPERPRVFSIDNGVAFSGAKNFAAMLGDDWGFILVMAVSRAKIEILRGLEASAFDHLATVVQVEIHDGVLVEVPPGDAFDAGRGVRQRGDVIQLGLTAEEIAGIWERVRFLLEQVDTGQLGLY